MIKVGPAGAYPELNSGPQLAAVNVASGGLRGTDLDLLVKAASHTLADWVRQNPPPPGEQYVHARAMGATEFVGPNRNFDGYSLTMLRRDLPTFEKFAFWYLNHNNSDPKRSYGRVKRAFLNENTGIVDVIASLNATKAAAERNGNLVAERTLQKLASNIDVAVSQSCRVPFDTCVACGNRAKNRAHYCTADTCKYGGCRNNLGRVFDDGFHLYVDNPHCTFFDLSDVGDSRGADRAAFITGKVAAAGSSVGGAELAERLGLVAPDHVRGPGFAAARRALDKLAAAGQYPEPVGTWAHIVETRGGVAPDLSGATDAERHEKVAALAAAGVLLPPDIWLSAVTGAPVDACAAPFVGGVSPGRDLLKRADAAELLEEYALPPAGGPRHALAPTQRAHFRESVYGALRRVYKLASAPPDTPGARDVRARYVAYQCGVIGAHENLHDLGLLHLEAIRHNRSTT